jgi:putative polyhydroxyalkanoate system protein
MPSLSISTPHALTQEEATARLKSLFDKVKERHGDKVSNLEEKWDGNKLDFSFSTYGFNIKGDMIVESDQVKINGNLPFAAMMIKGQIEQGVRTELEKALA